MNCAEIKQIIQLYMDNELDARSTLDAQRHLETCPVCSRLLDALAEQDRLLKQAARSVPLNSSHVRENILGAIQKETSKSARRWFLLPMWSRVVAVALIAIVAALLLLRMGLLPGSNQSVYAAVISDHADHCSIDNLMGAITDSDELAKLIALYGNMKVMPDLSAFGFGESRGRVCKVDGVEFLHLIFYNREQQPVSLFLRPRSSQMIAEELRVIHRDNYNAVSISRSGIELLVVSSLDDKQTSAIAQALAAQLEAD